MMRVAGRFWPKAGRQFSAPILSRQFSTQQISTFKAAMLALTKAVHSQEAVTAIANAASWTDADSKTKVSNAIKEQLSSTPNAKLFVPGVGGKEVTAAAPLPNSTTSITMQLPSKADIETILNNRAETPTLQPKDLHDSLEKFYKSFLEKRVDHAAMISVWGPKTISDSMGELEEVAAVMALTLRAHKQADDSPERVFESVLPGKGKDCLVLPPSNFALLGLKDIFDMLLHGYRVLCVVQPRFYKHYQMIAEEFSAAGIKPGLLDIVPGISPEADPESLHAASRLKQVHRLQFTGSSAMFKSLVLKAYEQDNRGLDFAGEISGLNKFRAVGVSAALPGVAQGAAWAAAANHGELCTSTSVVEVDTAHCSLEDAKKSIESVQMQFGDDITDSSIGLLRRNDKTAKLEVITDENPSNITEWWEKKAIVAPLGKDTINTNQSLGYCVFAPTIREALDAATDSDASNVYCASTDGARVGTTGARLPYNAFGGQKTSTFAVAGDHDGVGTVQALLSGISYASPKYRESSLSHSDYELTDNSQSLLEFLSPADQVSFPRELGRILDTFEAICREPLIVGPYEGQPLADASGNRTNLLSLRAVKAVRPRVLLPSGTSALPDDLIKLAMVYDMCPLQTKPMVLHYLTPYKGVQRKVEDPLKSFLRFAKNTLEWEVIEHGSWEELTVAVEKDEYPPYFFCSVGAKELLDTNFVTTVAKQGGYVYDQGFPSSDPIKVFRQLTTTQAWTCGFADKSRADEVREELDMMWVKKGLKSAKELDVEIIQPQEKPHIPEPDYDDDFDGFDEEGEGMKKLSMDDLPDLKFEK